MAETGLRWEIDLNVHCRRRMPLLELSWFAVDGPCRLSGCDNLVGESSVRQAVLSRIRSSIVAAASLALDVLPCGSDAGARRRPESALWIGGEAGPSTKNLGSALSSQAKSKKERGPGRRRSGPRL